MQNILIVDDDKEIVKAIEIYLERKKYQIFKAYDGIEALEQIKKNDINLIILDIMMPNKDGIETLTEIRKDKNIPVILLSAKSEDIDKIHGLNLGADDYITKPFNPAELIARVNALLRRYTNFETEETNNKNIIKNGGLIINDDLKKVTIDGKEIKLTPTEYNILKFLTENKGKVKKAKYITEYKAGDIMSGENVSHVWLSLGQCFDGSVVILHSSPAGVHISGTPTPKGAENSQAIKLANKYMSKYYPVWNKKYPVKPFDYLGKYSQFR